MITRTFALDLLERAAWTFVQAFLGVFVAVSALPVHVADWKTLAGSAFGAGVAAVGALLKGVLAGLNGVSASTSKTVTAAQTIVAATATPAAEAAPVLLPAPDVTPVDAVAAAAAIFPGVDPEPVHSLVVPT